MNPDCPSQTRRWRDGAASGRAPRRPLLLLLLLALLALPGTASAQAAPADNTETSAVSPVVAELRQQVQQARDSGDEAGERAALERLIATLGERSEAAYRPYERLRQLLSDAGDYAAAIRVSKAQLETARGPAGRQTTLVGLVGLYGSLHQLDAAAQSLRDAETNLARLRSHPRWAVAGLWWQTGLAWAKATLATQQGRFENAEESWLACLASADAAVKANPEREGNAWQVNCRRGLINVLLLTGQLAEAGVQAEQLRLDAERMIERQQRASVQIRVDVTLGQLAIEQNRLDLARQILQTAIARLEASGSDARSLRGVQALRLLAQLEMLRGDWPAALTWHERREKLLSALGSDRGLTGLSNPEYGYTLLRLGRHAEALKMLRRVAKKRDEIYALDSLHALEGHAFLGLALAANGERAAARRELAAAIPPLLNLLQGERSSAEAGALRSARIGWLLDGYLMLLGEDADEGSELDATQRAQARDEAFRLADIARASRVQRALAASASRAQFSDPALAELARREQDLQRELSALSDAIGNLLARGRVVEDDSVVTQMRAQLTQLRQQHAATRADIARRFPDYAALLDPKPLGIEQTRALLKPGESLLAVYSGLTRTLVWALPAAGPGQSSAPAFASLALPAAQLDKQVRELRAALDPAAELSGTLPPYPFAASHALFQQLLAPVAAGWQGAQALIVVPHGRLGALPLGVLTTAPFSAAPAKLPYAELAGAPWLLKQVALAQLPAVSALPALRAGGGKARAQGRAFAGFGDPLFGAGAAKLASAGSTRATLQRRNLPRLRAAAGAGLDAKPDFRLLPPLPDTAPEIREVASALGADAGRDVFLQKRASETELKAADLADTRVLMFATHGLTGDELPGLYQPALALANPALTGEEGREDGLLTMEEVLGLRLAADWVVLSACNSGAGSGEGGEAVSGLGRAFFYAGAKSLLVTQWAVETVSARLLTTDTFRRQAANPGLPRTQALQQAALAVMGQSAGKAYSYAHPMFWAPYTLVGLGE